jgi:hypothetical protein
MTLDFDSARAPLGAAGLGALVRAVSRAHDSDETVWLEWKGQLDLDGVAGRVSVARCVLGFANRLPAVAGRYCEGRAFMVVGAEPGCVRGVEQVDGAVLEPRVNAYLGPEPPRWAPHWVAVDGVSVLVVEVAAPQQGDPVHCLWKDFEKYRNGDVFIRRHGATERASASEVQALVERAKGSAPRLTGLRVRAERASGLTPVDFSEATREAWLEREKQACLASLHKHRAAQQRAEAQSGKGRNASRLQVDFAGLTSAQQHVASLLESTTETVEEDRTEEQYEQIVAQYIVRCRQELPSALRRAAGAGLSPVTIVVENDTEDNYAQVVVEVYCPGDVDSVPPSSFVSRDKGLPSRPRPYGPRQEPRHGFLLPSYSTALANEIAAGFTDRGPSFDIERGGSVRLRFDPVDVRPQQLARLPEAVLLPGECVSAVTVEWSATSTSVSGVVRGSFELPVAGEPWPVEAALAYEGSDQDD